MKKYVVLLLLLVFGSCHHIAKGKVIRKRFYPAHSNTYWNGKFWQSEYIPDEYWFIIAGANETGTAGTEAIRVGQRRYDSTKVGDMVCNNGE